MERAIAAAFCFCCSFSTEPLNVTVPLAEVIWTWGKSYAALLLNASCTLSAVTLSSSSSPVRCSCGCPPVHPVRAIAAAPAPIQHARARFRIVRFSWGCGEKTTLFVRSTLSSFRRERNGRSPTQPLIFRFGVEPERRARGAPVRTLYPASRRQRLRRSRSSRNWPGCRLRAVRVPLRLKWLLLRLVQWGISTYGRVQALQEKNPAARIMKLVAAGEGAGRHTVGRVCVD